MALSTTQVNAAFVALLGRAAEGNANAWAVNSADTKTLANTILSVDGKFKNWLEQAKTNEDFVEALYKQVLGRNSDADGKAVWLKALASGTSREELMTKFVAAAKAEDPNLTAFYTSNQQFLENVYSALLNRGVDNSGLETWMNLLQNGVSRAEVVAKIIDAINANKDSDDYAIYNAKMSVADAVTKVFAGPKAGLNAEQNAELNKKLVNIMSSVTSAEVTEESIKAEIANVVGSYGKEAAPLTFKAVTENMENYDLGNAESATAQTFRGTINLQDGKKSTISDKATLKTSKFSDTLVVDVIPSTDNKEFDYSGSQVKTFASGDGITNLTINNGTAGIKNLDNTGISENLKITGAANVSGSITTALQYLEINTGGKADAKAEITVKASLKEYVGKGSGNDEMTVSGNGTVKTVDLGAGNDKLIVSGGSIENATINLGAGDDTFTFNSGTVSGATINGGTGTDTIVLSGDASAIKSLTGFEKISISENGTLKIAAFKGNIDSLKGANLALGASAQNKKLTLNASDATTIDLSKVVKDTTASSGADIELTNVGSGTTSGVTITLNKDDNIAEKIILVAGAKDNNAVTITGIASGDKLDAKLAGVASTITVDTNASKVTQLSSNASTVTNGKAYFVTADKAITTATEAKVALDAISAKFTAAGGSAKALIGFNNGDKSYLFAVNGNSNNDTTIDATELTLVGIVDNTFGEGDTVTAGVIEFA